MIIKNVSGEDLSRALSEVSQKYDNNIIWKNYKKLSEKRYRVTLRVADSTKAGHRLSFSYWLNKQLGHSNKGIFRRLVSACWHCHGDFFDILLRIQPKAIIITNKTKIYKDADGVIINNWQDWNIGSQMYPWYYSDACECNR